MTYAHCGEKVHKKNTWNELCQPVNCMRTGRQESGGRIMKIQFLGADREVTGSCHYVSFGETHFLVDCGMV